MREVQGKKQTVGSLKDKSGNLVNDAKGKANVLNDFFRSVFTTNCTPNLLPKVDIPTAESPKITIREDGIVKLLQQINPNKAPGPEDIPARVLKEVAESAAPYLKVIFDKSMSEGKVPRDWKIANVTPILKSGLKEDPANYRPISLTSLSGKIMEHIITSSLMSFLEASNFIIRNQHGFRKTRSCETQLALLTHDVLKSAENKRQVDAIFLDFRKAFDKVPHKKLLYKLKIAGINAEVIEWIKDFLTDREQRVVLDGISSNLVKVTSGVPQGSVIGPLLFLIYINDLSKEIDSKVRVFADDTVIYREIKGSEDRLALSNDLDKIMKWCDDWELDLNIDKCSVVKFFERQSAVNDYSYKLRGENLSVVESVKYLGVTLTNNLSWSTHIRIICGKALKKLGFVKRIVGKSEEKVRERCYLALVRPHLEYACSIWDPADKSSIREIERVQRKAIRFVKNCYDKSVSVTQMLKDAGWESLEQRRSTLRINLLNKFRESSFSEDLLDIMRLPSYIGRKDTANKIREIDAKTNRFMNSFFPRTIRDSNRFRN